ncbi:MAG: type II secretion system F family protein [Thermoguttaceae bacterium]|jgi:tight adherence protein C
MLLASDLIDVETMLPLALFATFAALSWWALEWIVAAKPRVVERLDDLKNPRLRRERQAETLLKRQDALSKVLAKTNALTKQLAPKNEAEKGKMRTRLNAAGFRTEGATAAMFGMNFVGLMVGLFLGGGTALLVRGADRGTLLWTAAVAAVLFYLPDLVVAWLGKRRRQAIFLALPDALDMMVVCVEAGLGLDQAMRRVSDEMSRAYRVFTDELAITNFQLQMGRSRADALHELGTRTDVSDLRSLAAVIIQAEKFGSSVAQALRVQSESMRTRRRQLAEEKASKTAVKLIFPLVLFIFPGIFVILVGPAAIDMVRNLFPKMSGQG